MKTWIKRFLIIGTVGVVMAATVVIYLFNMPHRDVIGEEASASLTSLELVEAFLTDEVAANQQYLDRVVEITGTVRSAGTNSQGLATVSLKESGQRAAVRCTFTEKTSMDAETLAEGSRVTIKGIIRAGATYDADMDLYENVVVEKSILVNTNP